MTNTKVNNKEFYVCPEVFYYIGSFGGVNATCTHQEFTLERGSKNVKGQYSITRTCKGCSANRRYFLYATVAKKGRR